MLNLLFATKCVSKDGLWNLIFCHFLKILIKTREPTTGIRQLSLSEWSLWQDHPLPTHQVDHSDRCHSFISIMQMIEGMRHEEVEFSYTSSSFPSSLSSLLLLLFSFPPSLKRSLSLFWRQDLASSTPDSLLSLWTLGFRHVLPVTLLALWMGLSLASVLMRLGN